MENKNASNLGLKSKIQYEIKSDSYSSEEEEEDKIDKNSKNGGNENNFEEKLQSNNNKEKDNDLSKNEENISNTEENQENDNKNMNEKQEEMTNNKNQDTSDNNDDNKSQKSDDSNLQNKKTDMLSKAEIINSGTHSTDEITNSRNPSKAEGIESSTFVTEALQSNLISSTYLPFERKENNEKSEKPEKQESSIYQTQSQSQFIDPQKVENAMNAFLKDKTIPPTELVSPVIDLMNNKKIDYLEVSDYGNAEKMDRAIELLIKMIEELELQKAEDEKNKSFKNRLDSLNSKLSEINQKYDDKILSLQNALEEKIQELGKKQEAQIKQFKEKWQSQEQIKQFDRPSKQLLSMRHIEKQMALSKRYDDARKTKALADKIQNQEEVAAQKTMEDNMKADFLKLRSLQQKEVDNAARHCDKQIEELEMQREKEIAPIKIAIRQMDMKKTYSKKIIKVPKSQQTQILLQTPKQTPNKNQTTAVRMVKYRNEFQADLSIAPIDDEQFIKLTKATQKQKQRSKSSLPPL